MTILEFEQERTDRRKLVLVAAGSGRSNRAIAKELDVDEGTIRNDRRVLATLEHLRPVKKPKSKKIRVHLGVPELNAAERPVRRFEATLKVLIGWTKEEHFVRADLEFVLETTATKLFERHCSIRPAPNRISTPIAEPQFPADLLILTRPEEDYGNELPAKLESDVIWLINFLHSCWPYDELVQAEILRQTSIWAQGPTGFVY